MEQFQRFEEDQQFQTFQQPVGFSPIRSVSQGDAIRRQYQQTEQSKQFYNNSLKQRQDIREYNWKIKDQNEAAYSQTLNRLGDFIPTFQKMAQDEVDKRRRAVELEAANEEWNEVYENGFTEQQRIEEAAGKAVEESMNEAFADATFEAAQQTQSSEIARITSEKNLYKRAAKARVYAQRMAMEDPIALKEYLADFSQQHAANNNGIGPTSADIRGAVASFNGKRWSETGLSQFKPTFLGEKYMQTYRANQEKVITSQIKINEISNGATIRTKQDALSTKDNIIGNEIGWFSTYIADRSATLNGKGNLYGRSQSLADAKKALVSSGMSLPEAYGVLSKIPDPVIKGKFLIDRPGIKDEMAIAFSNRTQNQLSVQKTQETVQFREQFEPFAQAYAAAEAAKPGSGAQMLMQFNRDTAHLLYADRSALNRLVSGLRNPEALKQARMEFDQMRREGKTITKEMLDNSALAGNPTDYRYYLDQARRDNQQRTQEQKTIDGYLGQAVKDAGTAFYKDLGDGTGLQNTPLGDQLEDVLRTEVKFQLAEVQRDSTTAGLDREQQIRIAADRAIKLAKTKYGVGLTQQDVNRRNKDDNPDNDVEEPIFATNAGIPQDSALSAQSELETFDQNAATIDLDKAGSVYSQEELAERSQEIRGESLAKILPTWRERQIMEDQGITLSELINRQRAALNQPAIPASVWEQQIEKLPASMRHQFLNPNTTDEQRTRTQGQMEMPPPPAPTEQAQAHTGQGGPSLPVSTDSQGNHFNQAAVLANPNYGQFAAPYLPLIERAAKESGVPAALLAALAGQESHFKNFEGVDVQACGGTSRAQGPFQVLPACHPTAPNYKTDMYGHILYAANYLKSLYDQEGSWKAAMRRYNGGYSDDEYQDPVLKNAYGYGMNELLSSRDLMRPTFAQYA